MSEFKLQITKIAHILKNMKEPLKMMVSIRNNCGADKQDILSFIKDYPISMLRGVVDHCRQTTALSYRELMLSAIVSDASM